MRKEALRVIKGYTLPRRPRRDRVYVLLPIDSNEAYYRERTDRNIGFTTRKEQKILRKCVIGVAGCGGMGATLAERFVRLGVGEVRIADNEVFDTSNINRQYGAGRYTVGKSKAFVTARLLRRITNDTKIVVYPAGICEKTAAHFVKGCDIIVDEIEFWAIAARILLHQMARRANITTFCSPTVGFGSRLFRFTPKSGTMEECIGFTYEEAVSLQEKIQTKTATAKEINLVMKHVLDGLIPELPEYCKRGAIISNRKFLKQRLFKEGRATIFPTNPPLAVGLIGDHVALHLLRNSGVARNIIPVPPMPGYHFIDAAHVTAKTVRKRWWNHGKRT